MTSGSDGRCENDAAVEKVEKALTRENGQRELTNQFEQLVRDNWWQDDSQSSHKERSNDENRSSIRGDDERQ
jgi:hypothetical protein